MNSAEIHTLIEALNDARAARDWDRVAELLTDDFEYVVPRNFDRPPLRESAAIDALAGALLAELFELSTVRRVIKRVTVETDIAIVEQTLIGTTLTQQPYENDYVWIYEIRDGKICRAIEHLDTLHAASILGLSDRVGAIDRVVERSH
jgi:uncharacterized protein